MVQSHKRADGMDGINVTNSTFLCDKHFIDSDIKKNLNRWSLRQGAVPSLHLHGAERPKPSRKSPTKRELMPSSTDASSSFPDYDDDEDTSTLFGFSSPFVSMSTQTDFSFVNSVLYTPTATGDESDVNPQCSDDVSMENDLLNMCRHNESLVSSVTSLRQQVLDLEQQLAKLKNTLFTIEKLKNDDAAVNFYTGFPNFESLCAVFEYFESKLERM